MKDTEIESSLCRNGKMIKISKEDEYLVKLCSWNIDGKGYYRVKPRCCGKRTTIFLHRIIGARIHGEELTKKQIVDHINGDTTDNRRCNLRITDSAGNGQHRPNQKSRGVTFIPSLNRWQAQVGHKGKFHYLGLFSEKKDALLAAENKRNELGFMSQVATKNNASHAHSLGKPY